jgi:hypothetical protein
MVNVTSFTTRSDFGRPVWQGCTAAEGIGDFCENEVPQGAPVSMCGKHLIAAYRFCEEALGQAERSERFERLADVERRRYGTTGTAVVYYMLFGRNIKIGTTADIYQRMRQLRPDAVLATEPGYFELERKRHEQFRHLKLEDGRNEYFRPGADLMRFIRSLPNSIVPPEAARRPKRTAAAIRAKREREHIGPNGQISIFEVNPPPSS